ncbi:MAG: cyclic nucleotide-binding domain-containing protein [Spirochaetaceae bacterium]|nr:cyclic nucleotide-binding domain-containing protein [Spirochaetaceae bacterium]
MLQLSFINCRPGSYILIEGKEENSRFYIIQSGKVQVSREVEVVKEEGGNILNAGDFIGVVSCMSGHSQIETAVALTDATLISVRKDQYSELIQKNGPIAMKIILSFARKMRYLNEALTMLTLKNTTVSSPEMIFTIAEYYEKAGKPSLAFFSYYQYLRECPQGEFVSQARNRFVALKYKSSAVYLEPSADLTRIYPKDTMIFSEFQTGQDMFIIQEGQVKITKVVNNNEVILAVLKKGDFFGEMALLENKPRSASAIAHESCTLMTVNRKNFEQMVKTQPQLIARLTTTLSERIWGMYKQLANTLISDPVGKLFDMLAIQMEKSKVQIAPGVSYTFDIGPLELANMCGIPKINQSNSLIPFLKDNRIKLRGERIYVTDTSEIMKQAVFFRNRKKERKK